MRGPARAGLLIYATDIDRVARFYEALLGMVRIHETPELAVLESPDIQMVVHRHPPEIASAVVIESPPERRVTALKFFFTVPSLANARAAARALGGTVDKEEWPGIGFTVCNAVDPEGNIFHLRERTPGP